jgi:maleylpyruvate isomerase
VYRERNEGGSAMILHDYWRSSAAYRLRIALNLKGLDYTLASHDLRAGEQKSADYVAIAPQGFVPALDTGEGVLIQSLAIIEWLDERYPQPPLLPRDPLGRATVRAMAQVVACDIHPVNNLRILKALKADFGASQEVVDAWVRRWVEEGFTALERLVAEHGEGFAYGETPTMADVLLVPQWYNGERFGLDCAPFPRLAAVVARARALPAFAAASPDVQPGAD